LKIELNIEKFSDTIASSLLFSSSWRRSRFQ